MIRRKVLCKSIDPDERFLLSTLLVNDVKIIHSQGRGRSFTNSQMMRSTKDRSQRELQDVVAVASKRNKQTRGSSLLDGLGIVLVPQGNSCQKRKKKT